MKYVLIRADSAVDMTNKVQQLLDKGWVLHGTLHITGIEAKYPHFYQAMVLS